MIGANYIGQPYLADGYAGIVSGSATRWVLGPVWDRWSVGPFASGWTLRDLQDRWSIKNLGG